MTVDVLFYVNIVEELATGDEDFAIGGGVESHQQHKRLVVRKMLPEGEGRRVLQIVDGKPDTGSPIELSGPMGEGESERKKNTQKR